MNTLHLVYALEVEKTSSITQAAENLYMTQPTLSKAMKDLEAGLGFRVFRRTSRGVVPTHKGEEFLRYARKIVSQIEKMENALAMSETVQQIFSLAIPRASYISKAAANYLSSYDNRRDMELDIKETNSVNVIDSVSEGYTVLGIIRYFLDDEQNYLKYVKEKGLQYENLWQSSFVAVMPKEHPLAGETKLTPEDFAPYIEIAYGDEKVPYYRASSHESGSAMNTKRILVYDRGTQFDILRANPLSFMWSSPIPKDILEQNRLVQKKVPDSRQFKDLLVSRNGYRFSKMDREFINELTLLRNEVAYGEG